MKKRWLAGLMTHQYKQLQVTMKMWIVVLSVGRKDYWSQLSDGLMDCRNQRLTISFSASRLFMWVTDMGRKSLMVLGCGTWGTGVTIDVSHWAGSVPVEKDKLSMLHTGPASSTEHCLMTQQGELLGLGEVCFKLVSSCLTSYGSREF